MTPREDFRASLRRVSEIKRRQQRVRALRTVALVLLWALALMAANLVVELLADVGGWAIGLVLAACVAGVTVVIWREGEHL